MSRVKSKDSNAEKIVRSIAHRLGYRFRIHRKDLPGTPDIVFPSKKKVIFVNGCYWHGHRCKRGKRLPKSNTQYWTSKIERNIQRDKRNIKALKKLGWDILVIWECKINNEENISNLIGNFLSSQNNNL